ncbi:MAG: RNA 2',3'-cyclic phosphodiesterase [Acidimicrobiia bacterium]
MNGNVFLAVALTATERHDLAAALSEERIARRLPGRRVGPANWHVTVRFVGEAAEAEVDRLAERVESYADEVWAGRVWVTGIGGFPRASKATVAYAGIDDPSRLLTVLAAICDEAAIDVGFDPETRPFVPHLTLSRIRPAVDLSGLVDGLSARVPVEVAAITVFRTEQIRGGVAYRAIHEISLRKAARR